VISGRREFPIKAIGIDFSDCFRQLLLSQSASAAAGRANKKGNRCRGAGHAAVTTPPPLSGISAMSRAETFTRVEENPVPTHLAETLTDGGNLARIDLNGQVYWLRITRAGKLILTK